MTYDLQKIQKLLDSCFFLPKDVREKLRKINEDGTEKQRKELQKMLKRIEQEYLFLIAKKEQQFLEKGFAKAKNKSKRHLFKTLETKEKQNIDDELIQKLNEI
jgi:hypothetical protein